MRRVKLAASRNSQTDERIDGSANEGMNRLAVGEATARGRIVTTGPATAAGFGWYTVSHQLAQRNSDEIARPNPTK